jgi:hypothetical protein
MFKNTSVVVEYAASALDIIFKLAELADMPTACGKNESGWMFLC